MKGSAGNLVTIAFRAPKAVRVALTRILADAEEAGITAHDGSRVTRNDIVAAIITQTNKLAAAEKEVYLRSAISDANRSHQA